MQPALNIPKTGALDLVSLGALVHRLDPGIIPFRKATECQIHVSGGEFNVAANLADCFGIETGIATAMVNYPIGDLVAERVKAMGVKPFYKRFEHDGVGRARRLASVVAVETEMRRQRVEGLAAVGQIGDQGVDPRMIERFEVDVEKFITLADQMRQNMPAGLAGSSGEYHALACHFLSHHR